MVKNPKDSDDKAERDFADWLGDSEHKELLAKDPELRKLLNSIKDIELRGLLAQNPEYVAYLNEHRIPFDENNFSDISSIRAGAPSASSSSPVGVGRRDPYTAGAPSFSGASPISSSGSGCFVATAAYEGPLAEEVVALRRLRDDHLLGTFAGRAVVDCYYRLSPSLASFIRQRTWARRIARAGLRPLVALARRLPRPRS